MPGVTRTRYNEIQEAARQLVASIGIARLDELSNDASATIKRGLAKQLVSTSGVTMQTARQHIARACRRERYEGWGGARQNSGRPKNHSGT